MPYDFRNEFNGLSNKEINRTVIGPEQKELLGSWMGIGRHGALAARGKPLPEELSEQALRAYHEIARREVANGNDRGGAQQARMKLIEMALDSLDDASTAEEADP